MNDCCLFVVFSLKFLAALIFLIAIIFSAFVNALIYSANVYIKSCKFSLLQCVDNCFYYVDRLIMITANDLQS